MRPSCRGVSRCGARAFKWTEQAKAASLLNIALEHLMLGRAALYEAILESRSRRRASAPTSSAPEFDQRGLTSAATELDAAVAGLRGAGTTHHLPRGLLNRAWLWFLTGERTGPESAQADLDEAWEIAERGPMRLHLADILLTRARLFGTAGQVISSQSSVLSGQKYPWESPAADLAAAEKLINECGYHRRD